MEYLAHIEGERRQSVKDHLYGTAELAGNFAERFGKREWGILLRDASRHWKVLGRVSETDPE